MEKRKIPNRIKRAYMALIGKETPEFKKIIGELKLRESELKKEFCIQTRVNDRLKAYTKSKTDIHNRCNEELRKIAKLYSTKIGSVTGSEYVRTPDEIDAQIEKIVSDCEDDLRKSSKDKTTIQSSESSRKKSIFQRLKKALESLINKDVLALAKIENSIQETEKCIKSSRGEERNKIKADIKSVMLRDENERAAIKGRCVMLDQVADTYAEEVGIQGEHKTSEIHASRLVANRLKKVQDDLKDFIEKCEKLREELKEGNSQGSANFVNKFGTEFREQYNILLGQVYGEIAVMLEIMKEDDINTIIVGGNQSKTFRQVVTVLPKIFGTGIKDNSSDDGQDKREEKYQLPPNSIGGMMQKIRDDESQVDVDVAMSAMTAYKNGIKELTEIGFIVRDRSRFNEYANNSRDFDFTQTENLSVRGYIWLLHHYFGLEYEGDKLKAIVAEQEKSSPLSKYKKDGQLPNNPEVNQRIETVYEIGKKISSSLEDR